MKCTLTQQLTHLCILLLTCNALSSKLHQNAYAVVSAHGGGFSASVGNGNAGVSIGDSGNASQGGDDGAFSQGGGGSGLEAGISGSGGGDGPKLWLHLRRRGRRGGRSRGNDSSEDHRMMARKVALLPIPHQLQEMTTLLLELILLLLLDLILLLLLDLILLLLDLEESLLWDLTLLQAAPTPLPLVVKDPR